MSSTKLSLVTLVSAILLITLLTNNTQVHSQVTGKSTQDNHTGGFKWPLSCETIHDCPRGGDCYAGNCYCPVGYFWNMTNKEKPKCERIQNCTSEGNECKRYNAECNFDIYCMCPKYFDEVQGPAGAFILVCRLNEHYDPDCNSATNCTSGQFAVTNSECIRGQCICKFGYKRRFDKCIKIICEAGHHLSDDGKTCVKVTTTKQSTDDEWDTEPTYEWITNNLTNKRKPEPLPADTCALIGVVAFLCCLLLIDICTSCIRAAGTVIAIRQAAAQENDPEEELGDGANYPRQLGGSNQGQEVVSGAENNEPVVAISIGKSTHKTKQSNISQFGTPKSKTTSGTRKSLILKSKSKKSAIKSQA